MELKQLSSSLLPTIDMEELIVRCINEDGGFKGDVTSHSIISDETIGRFAIHVRGSGTVAGLEPLSRAMGVFEDLSIEIIRKDGDTVHEETIGILSGSMRTILLAERTLLNILGHASGIATRTQQYVSSIAQTNCVVTDTRKTTPGLRMFDKYAVACGGGVLHRLGLHDAALYKDNHLAGLQNFSTQLSAAVNRVKADHQLKFVEVEVDTLQQLQDVLALSVDIVLLDNMSVSKLQEAVAMREVSTNSPLLEASGGITLETVLGIAQTGVDRVAVGDLTHHAPWLDIGLDAIDD